MANIISIGTALPEYGHQQSDILPFMQQAYRLDETEKRKLAFMYSHSGINKRYSVVPDFGNTNEATTFGVHEEKEPTLEQRMGLYHQHAAALSLKAIDECIKGVIDTSSITHLITVSCTGLSAPGLDLEIMEALNLPGNIFRTSINFMGCYAALHALKLAKIICDGTKGSNVLIVATELCTIHFQKEYTLDNAASSLLFADGSAAVLVSNEIKSKASVSLKSFYSHVAFEGKKDMAWEVSSNGFLMTLSSYIPELIKEDIGDFVSKALTESGLTKEDVTHWCIHPGGKRILDVIQRQLQLNEMDLSCSRKVLSLYGNISSATILFVLKEIMTNLSEDKKANIFGVAFGPGLTMETFVASTE